MIARGVVTTALVATAALAACTGGGSSEPKNCTVEYPAYGGVAACRFWAKIASPEVRLENCAQQ